MHRLARPNRHRLQHRAIAESMHLEDVFASGHARDPEATVSTRQDDAVRPRNPDLRLHQDRRVDADNRARHTNNERLDAETQRDMTRFPTEGAQQPDLARLPHDGDQQ